MRLVLLTLLSLSFFFVEAQQANLYTIPNQSAEFIRMPSRNTSTDVDAVFFNNAALSRAEDGFYFSINNQVLNQITKVSSDYQYYLDGREEYPGRVTGFIFPSVFVNYKRKKFSYNAGFFLVGGAGGVTYDNLPVADRGIADIIPALQNSVGISLNELDADILNNTGSDPMFRNLTDYRFSFENKGLGYSPAFQAGLSYEINDKIAVGVAYRFVSQRVRSEGFTNGIQILPQTSVDSLNNWTSPGDYLRAIGAGQNDPLFTASGATYDLLAADREIDIQQNGTGMIPVFSVHVKPIEDLTIALKYEPRTNIKLKTKVIAGKDGGEQGGRPVFIDGEEVRSDLPGYLAGGIKYAVNDKWNIATGGTYAFIQNANFNGRDSLIRGPYYIIELATDYQLFDKFLVSGGYTYNKAVVAPEYHNDVDFWLPGHTVGFGGKIDFNDNLAFNFGALLSFFNTQNHTFNHTFADGNVLATPSPDYTGTYEIEFKKSAYIFAVGAEFAFPNKKANGTMLEESTASDSPYLYRGY